MNSRVFVAAIIFAGIALALLTLAHRTVTQQPCGECQEPKNLLQVLYEQMSSAPPIPASEPLYYVPTGVNEYKRWGY